jgi:serine/threonine-protein kinase HipA
MNRTPPSERTDAFVWVWLPAATAPVPAGRVRRIGDHYRFIYGDSYLADPDAVSLFEPELPLRPGWIDPGDGLTIAGALRDAAPDAWGRRVVLHRLFGNVSEATDPGDIDEITYLLESGSNRIGALDFQRDPGAFVDRADEATLDELHGAADALEAGRNLRPALAEALVHGTSIGGARPKLLVSRGSASCIAKLSSASDHLPVVKAEAVVLELARRIGIEAPDSHLAESLGRDVLLIDRFDRAPDGSRRMMVSALTMLGLHEEVARYATYPDLLDVLRRDGTDPAVGLRLFERIVFNVAIGNHDDHARNHAAFWDGRHLTLTPAFDLTPQARSGDTAAQAMAIDRDGNRASRFSVCIAAAGVYGLSRREAERVVDHQVSVIEGSWEEAAELAHLSSAERNMLFRRQILNPFAFYDE